jgi:acyl-CoA hydrolase
MTTAAHTINEILALLRPEDTLHIPLATGQPLGLMHALAGREDWKRLEIFTGLFVFPFPILQHPGVRVISGYYGPIERMLNQMGANIEYLPADFTGFEIYASQRPGRVVAATFSPPDAEGFVTFGSHCGAIDRPFRAALADPGRIAIAEINPHMPVIYGEPACGDNKIALADLGYWFENAQSPIEPPIPEPTEAERRIAGYVITLPKSGATLQFGIGAIPNLIAEMLARSQLGDFGIHSELVSDGFLKLVEAGKISNRHKGVFAGKSVFTFAFGSQALYDFLDERNGRNRRTAVALPVSVVNDPAVIARNKNFISINSGLMVDFAGQVCSEAIGLRQYSGVGGQLAFVQGAYHSDGGRSILCIKSTATVNGKAVSNIVPTLPAGSLISTPRHYVQTIVTEHGIADLYGVSDEDRAEKLIAVAHPDFRAGLTEKAGEIRKAFHKPV